MNGQRGFSFIELMVVLIILALLAGIATPIVYKAVTRAKESALKENLYVMRTAIDYYYTNTGKYPQTLETLVEEKYLRNIPRDPFTKEKKWKLIYDEENNILDIHSNYRMTSENGDYYDTW